MMSDIKLCPEGGEINSNQDPHASINDCSNEKVQMQSPNDEAKSASVLHLPHLIMPASEDLNKQYLKLKVLIKKQLLEGEKLSLTFEALLVLCLLQSLSFDLQSKILKEYGDIITDNVTLMEFREAIFSYAQYFLSKQSETSEPLSCKLKESRADSVSTNIKDGFRVRESTENMSGENILEEDSPGKESNVTSCFEAKVTYACNECDKLCDSKQSLKGHREQVHLKDYRVGKVCGTVLLDNDESRSTDPRHEKIKCERNYKADVGKEENLCDIKYESQENINNFPHESVDKMANSVNGLYHLSFQDIECDIHCDGENVFDPELENSMYKCPVCDKIILGFQLMSLHLEQHFPDVENEDLVNKLIKDIKPVKTENIELEIEMDERKTKNLEKHFECDQCCKTFKGERTFKNHKNKHVCVQCPKCTKSFQNHKVLTAHMKTHYKKPKKKVKSADGQKSMCSDCGVTFSYQSNLIRHRKTHHQPQTKSLPCEVCGKLFSNKYNLRSHLQTHSTLQRVKVERNFTCEICSRSFITEELRNSHVCKHYSCDTCGEKFIRERNLKLHKRWHAGETIFSCSVCEALFDKKKLLCTHKNTTHSEKKKYKCDECPKIFKNTSGLKAHQLWHKGEKPFRCETCGSSFKTKAHLKSHMAVHKNDITQEPFECEGCGTGFRDLLRLKSHREKKLCGVTSGDTYQIRKCATVPVTSQDSSQSELPVS